ncbi:ras-related protein Rab-32B-like [Ptychodera flava]|uniref:ras-related protein Rab-32B-like n=1 Tax=Ptychodera flava TaxID=63121 RepID=UPI00396A1187
MTRVYYKYAIAAIIVFDLSRPATFDSVLKWYNDVNQKVMLANGQPVPVILLANKCDLEDVVVDNESLNSFCKTYKFMGWFATSAKEDKNINEAMVFLVQNILHLTTEDRRQDDCIMLPSQVYPDEPDDLEENKKDTCCLTS